VGDAATHLAGADNTDRLQRTHCQLPGGALLAVRYVLHHKFAGLFLARQD
jgi:hypothetical protein